MPLSKLPPSMVDQRCAIDGSLSGNILTVTYSDDTSTSIDLGPWVEAKLSAVKATINRWDQWAATSGSGNANLVFNYPASGMVGTAFTWSITGGKPNTTFTLRANDAGSGLSVTTKTLDAEGRYTGQSTPSKNGSFTVSAVMSTGGEIAKPINVEVNPAIPIVYNPTVNFPGSASQNTAFSWSITGGKPLSTVRVSSNQSGLDKGSITLDANGSTGQTSTPLFYGPGSVTFTFEDGKTIAKNITVFAAAGTLISEFCEGYNLMRNVADGNGGVNKVLVQANNVEQCGYIQPVGPSGIPTNLYSSVAGGKSTCMLTFPFDGTWHTYEYKTAPGPNAQVTHQQGVWLPNEAIGPGRDDTGVGKFEIAAKLVSSTHNGVAFVPYGYDPTYPEAWVYMGGPAEGQHQSQVITYAVDQSYYPGETIVFVWDFKIRWIASQEILMAFRMTMTAAAACFSVDTWIKTPAGDRILSTMKVGEVVSSFDAPDLIDADEAGWMAWTSPVETAQIDSNRTSVVVKAERFSATESIKINGFHSTLWHVHLVASNGLLMWKRASDITYDDYLVAPNKQLVKIHLIEHFVTPYEFMHIDVEDLDTIIVRNDSTYILGHNAS